MEKNISFLAVGDVVSDLFIRIKDASVHCNLNNESCELCLRFADKVPFESATEVRGVGNSANAAVAGARLGLESTLMASVGNDTHGAECMAELEKNNVGTQYIRVCDGLPTNYHYVLWYESERTILIKHTDFPYELPANLVTPDWIYLSSMGEHAKDFYPVLAEYLQQNPSIKLAFQPGTYQMKLGTEYLRDFYARAEIFVCNVEESQRILKTTESDHKKLLSMMHNLGPKIVCITDGPRGAYASDGTHAYYMPIYPDPKPPYERTGAGDAFASTFTTAIARGMTLTEALRYAPVNSMSVVQYVGAQEGLLSDSQIQEWLQKAPADYQPKEI